MHSAYMMKAWNPTQFCRAQGDRSRLGTAHYLLAKRLTRPFVAAARPRPILAYGTASEAGAVSRPGPVSPATRSADANGAARSAPQFRARPSARSFARQP